MVLDPEELFPWGAMVQQDISTRSPCCPLGSGAAV